MSRVIAVKEEQLSAIRDKYIQNKPAEEIVQNNAAILNETLSTPVMPQNPMSTSVPNIDMESQVVNMNATPVNIVNEALVSPVNAEITGQVFGNPFDSGVGSNNSFEPIIPDLNSFNANMNQINDTSASNLLQEESKEISNLNDDNIITVINSIRNDFDMSIKNLSDSFHKKMDELQEKVIVKNSSVVETKSENVIPTNDFTVSQMSQPDLDETMIIPANVMASAIEESQNSMSLAA